ncbi:MAG: hypothetical protein GY866_19590 [Proteobacteria bacterium]|nr:hypothetical protein [Pseudomonadota bacterium]
MDKTDQAFWEEILDKTYSSDKLTTVYKTYLVEFIENNPQIFQEWGLNGKEFEALYIRKKQLVKLLSIVFSDGVLFKEWLKLLSESVRTVLERVVWEGGQDIGKLEKQLKEKILIRKKERYGGSSYLAKDEYCFLPALNRKSAWGSGGGHMFFDLPPLIRTKLKPFFPPPDGFELRTTTSTPKTDFIYRNQGTILKELPLVINYIQQGQLKLTKSGIPQKSALSQLQKYCEAEEFYRKTEHKELRTLRIELLVHLILKTETKETFKQPLDVLAGIFKSYWKTRFFPSLSLATHLKGWNHTSAGFNQHVHPNIVDLLKKLPVEEWISFDGIRRYALLRDMDLGLVDWKEADRYLYSTSQWKGWGSAKNYIKYEQYDEAVLKPVVRAVLFLFASLGLLDIAYNYPKNAGIRQKEKPYLTVYDGLEYIRLTELGAYLFEGKKRYLPEVENEEPAEIVLDEERLIVSLSRNDKMMGLVLETFAEKIGRNRYKVDFTSFLKGCSSKDDIQEKIRLFKRKVVSNPPEIWHDFFSKALFRVNPLEPQPNLVVYRLRPDDNELIRFLTTDKTIKKYVLKAEGYHIAIREEDFDKVKKRLEHFGYLL